MSANRKESVTLLVPTVASRADLFRRVLIHFEFYQYTGPIVVSDHSAVDDRHILAKVAADFPTLNLTIRHHDPDLPFLERLADCADSVATPYTALHADDDFMHFGALASCTDFLDANPDYVACKGRMAFFRIKNNDLKVNGHRGRTRDEANVFTRLTRHLGSFTATLYAVHRREQFIESCRRTLAVTQNVIFWQYLSSCITIVQGKLKTLNELFYLRQQNTTGWQQSLINDRDPEHWPYLVTSPDFSRYMNEFRLGLLAVLAEKAGSQPNGFATSYEDALVWLVRHGIAKQQMEAPEKQEEALYERFADASTPEARFLGTCVATAAEPDRVRAQSRREPETEPAT